MSSFLFVFFFSSRRRHTRYIGDWSSDVCSSDLFWPYPRVDGYAFPVHLLGWTMNYEMFFYAVFAAAILLPRRAAIPEIGRASCRERGEISGGAGAVKATRRIGQDGRGEAH